MSKFDGRMDGRTRHSHKVVSSPYNNSTLHKELLFVGLLASAQKIYTSSRYKSYSFTGLLRMMMTLEGNNAALNEGEINHLLLAGIILSEGKQHEICYFLYCWNVLIKLHFQEEKNKNTA